MSFTRAERRKAKLRLGLIGPSGSGKSATALRIASALGKRIACIDSENGSLNLYAPTASDAGFCPQGFDCMNLAVFSPQAYTAAIKLAEKEGYDVIIIDSLSHAWAGSGGSLEQVDNAMARSHGNKWAAWRDVTPHHNALINAIIQSTCHVIATMRTKTEYTTEKDDRGKVKPVKIGLAPIQRDGMEYEFTMVGDMDLDHRLVITKTRCPEFDQAVILKPGPEVGQRLLEWLETGEVSPMPAAPPDDSQSPPKATVDQARTIVELCHLTKRVEADVCAKVSRGTVSQAQDLTADQAKVVIEGLGKLAGITNAQTAKIGEIYTAAGIVGGDQMTDAYARLGVVDMTAQLTWAQANWLLTVSLAKHPPVKQAAA